MILLSCTVALGTRATLGTVRTYSVPVLNSVATYPKVSVASLAISSHHSSQFGLVPLRSISAVLSGELTGVCLDIINLRKFVSNVLTEINAHLSFYG